VNLPRVVDLPRVRAALAELSRLVAAYPELRGAPAERLAALIDEMQRDDPNDDPKSES
jgi:hypothetical protein